MRYEYNVKYTSGKQLIVADTLSRSPLNEMDNDSDVLTEDVAAYVQHVIQYFLASDQRK